MKYEIEKIKRKNRKLKEKVTDFLNWFIICPEFPLRDENSTLRSVRGDGHNSGTGDGRSTHKITPSSLVKSQHKTVFVGRSVRHTVGYGVFVEKMKNR